VGRRAGTRGLYLRSSLAPRCGWDRWHSLPAIHKHLHDWLPASWERPKKRPPGPGSWPAPARPEVTQELGFPRGIRSGESVRIRDPMQEGSPARAVESMQWQFPQTWGKPNSTLRRRSSFACDGGPVHREKRGEGWGNWGTREPLDGRGHAPHFHCKGRKPLENIQPGSSTSG